MKVSGNSDSLSLDKVGRGNQRNVDNKGNSVPTSAPAHTENINFSDLSSKLQELEKSLATSDEFDIQKVNEIKQAIRDGKFLVDSGVVADKLLQSVQELFGKPA